MGDPLSPQSLHWSLLSVLSRGIKGIRIIYYATLVCFLCVWGWGLYKEVFFGGLWGIVRACVCLCLCVCVCVCVCRERVLVAFIQYPVRGCPHGQGTNGFPLKSGEE